jgi:hypothetical protein
MQSMAKLHTYYVTNLSTEVNYASAGLTNEELYNELNQSFNDTIEFSDEELREQEEELNQAENEQIDDEDKREMPETGNEIILENYFNFNEELQRAMEMEVRVIVEVERESEYDHGNRNFDISALLDANLRV